jgi:hypothetical protein
VTASQTLAARKPGRAKDDWKELEELGEVDIREFGLSLGPSVNEGKSGI